MSITPPQREPLPEFTTYQDIKSATGFGAWFSSVCTWVRSLRVMGQGNTEQKAERLLEYVKKQYGQTSNESLPRSAIALLARANGDLLSSVDSKISTTRFPAMNRCQQLVEQILLDKEVLPENPVTSSTSQETTEAVSVTSEEGAHAEKTKLPVVTQEQIKEAKEKVSSRLLDRLKGYEENNKKTTFPDAVKGFISFWEDKNQDDSHTKACLMEAKKKLRQTTQLLATVKQQNVQDRAIFQVTSLADPFGDATQSALLYEKLSPIVKVLESCYLRLSEAKKTSISWESLKSSLTEADKLLNRMIEKQETILKDLLDKKSFDNEKFASLTTQCKQALMHAMTAAEIGEDAVDSCQKEVSKARTLIETISKQLSEKLQSASANFIDMCGKSCEIIVFDLIDLAKTALNLHDNNLQSAYINKLQEHLKDPAKLLQEMVVKETRQATQPQQLPSNLLQQVQEKRKSEPEEAEKEEAPDYPLLPQLKSYYIPPDKEPKFLKEFPQSLEAEIQKGNIRAAALVLLRKDRKEIEALDLYQRLFLSAYLGYLENKPQKSDDEKRLCTDCSWLEESLIADLSNPEELRAKKLYIHIANPQGPTETQYLQRVKKLITTEIHESLAPQVKQQPTAAASNFVPLQDPPSSHIFKLSPDEEMTESTPQQVIEVLLKTDLQAHTGIYAASAQKMLEWKNFTDLINSTLPPQVILTLLDICHTSSQAKTKKTDAARTFALKLFEGRSKPDEKKTLEYIRTHISHATLGSFYKEIWDAYCEKFTKNLITNRDEETLKELEAAPEELINAICASEKLTENKLLELGYQLVEQNGSAGGKTAHLLANGIARIIVGLQEKTTDGKSTVFESLLATSLLKPGNTKPSQDFYLLVETMKELYLCDSAEKITTYANQKPQDISSDVLSAVNIPASWLSDIPSQNQHAELREKLLALDNKKEIELFKKSAPTNEWELFKAQAIAKLTDSAIKELDISHQLLSLPEELLMTFFNSDALSLGQKLEVADRLAGQAHLSPKSREKLAKYFGVQLYTTKKINLLTGLSSTLIDGVLRFRKSINEYFSAYELAKSLPKDIFSLPISQLQRLCVVVTDDKTASKNLGKQFASFLHRDDVPAITKARILTSIPSAFLPPDLTGIWELTPANDDKKQALLLLIDDIGTADENKQRLYLSCFGKLLQPPVQDPFVVRFARKLPDVLISKYIAGIKLPPRTEYDKIIDDIVLQSTQRFGRFSGPNADLIVFEKDKGPQAEKIRQKRHKFLSELTKENALTAQERLRAVDNLIYDASLLSDTERSSIADGLVEMLAKDPSGYATCIDHLRTPSSLQKKSKEQVDTFHKDFLKKFLQRIIPQDPKDIETFLASLNLLPFPDGIADTVVNGIAEYINDVSARNEYVNSLQHGTSYTATTLHDRLIALELAKNIPNTMTVAHEIAIKYPGRANSIVEELKKIDTQKAGVIASNLISTFRCYLPDTEAKKIAPDEELKKASQKVPSKATWEGDPDKTISSFVALKDDPTVLYALIDATKNVREKYFATVDFPTVMSVLKKLEDIAPPDLLKSIQEFLLKRIADAKPRQFFESIQSLEGPLLEKALRQRLTLTGKNDEVTRIVELFNYSLDNFESFIAFNQQAETILSVAKGLQRKLDLIDQERQRSLAQSIAQMPGLPNLSFIDTHSSFLQKIVCAKIVEDLSARLQSATKSNDFAEIAKVLTKDLIETWHILPQDATEVQRDVFSSKENSVFSTWELFDALSQPVPIPTADLHSAVQPTPAQTSVSQTVQTNTSSAVLEPAKPLPKHIVEAMAKKLLLTQSAYDGDGPDPDCVNALTALTSRICDEKTSPSSSPYRSLLECYVHTSLEAMQQTEEDIKPILPLLENKTCFLALIEKAKPQQLILMLPKFGSLGSDKEIITALSDKFAQNKNDLEDLVENLKDLWGQVDEIPQKVCHTLVCNLISQKVRGKLVSTTNKEELLVAYKEATKDLQDDFKDGFIQGLSAIPVKNVISFFIAESHDEDLDDETKKLVEECTLASLGKRVDEISKNVEALSLTEEKYKPLMIALASSLSTEAAAKFLGPHKVLIAWFLGADTVDPLKQLHVALAGRFDPVLLINRLTASGETIQELTASYLLQLLEKKASGSNEDTFLRSFWENADPALLLPVADAYEKVFQEKALGTESNTYREYRDFIVQSVAMRIEDLNPKARAKISGTSGNKLYRDIFLHHTLTRLEKTFSAPQSKIESVEEDISKIPTALRSEFLGRFFSTKNVSLTRLISIANYFVSMRIKAPSDQERKLLTTVLLSNVLSANPDDYKTAVASLTVGQAGREKSKFERLLINVLIPKAEQQLVEAVSQGPVDPTSAAGVAAEKILLNAGEVRAELTKRFLANTHISISLRAMTAETLFTSSKIDQAFKEQFILSVIYDQLPKDDQHDDQKKEFFTHMPSLAAPLTKKILSSIPQKEEREDAAQELTQLCEDLSETVRAEIFSALFSTKFFDFSFLYSLAEKSKDPTIFSPLLEEELSHLSGDARLEAEKFLAAKEASLLAKPLQARIFAEKSHEKEQKTPTEEPVSFESLKVYLASFLDPIETRLNVAQAQYEKLSSPTERGDLISIFLHQFASVLMPRPLDAKLLEGSFGQNLVSHLPELINHHLVKGETEGIQSVLNIVSHMPEALITGFAEKIHQYANDVSGEERSQIRQSLKQLAETSETKFTSDNLKAFHLIAKEALTMLDADLPKASEQDEFLKQFKEAPPSAQYEYIRNLNTAGNQRMPVTQQLELVKKLYDANLKDNGDEVFCAFARNILDEDLEDLEFLDALHTFNAHAEVLRRYARYVVPTLQDDAQKATQFFLKAPGFMRDFLLQSYLTDNCKDMLKTLEAILKNLPDPSVSIVRDCLSQLKTIPETPQEASPALSHLLHSARTKGQVAAQKSLPWESICSEFAKLQNELKEEKAKALFRQLDFPLCFTLIEQPAFADSVPIALTILETRMAVLDDTSYATHHGDLEKNHPAIFEKMRKDLHVPRWLHLMEEFKGKLPENVVKEIQKAPKDELELVFAAENANINDLLQLGQRMSGQLTKESRQAVASSCIKKVLAGKKIEFEKFAKAISGSWDAASAEGSLQKEIVNNFPDVAAPALKNMVLEKDRLLLPSLADATSKLATLPTDAPWGQVQNSTISLLVKSLPKDMQQTAAEAIAEEIPGAIQSLVGIVTADETFLEAKAKTPNVQKLRTAQYFTQKIQDTLSSAKVKDIASSIKTAPPQMQLELTVSSLCSQALSPENKALVADSLWKSANTKWSNALSTVLKPALESLSPKELTDLFQKTHKGVNAVIETIFVERISRGLQSDKIEVQDQVLPFCLHLGHGSLTSLIQDSLPANAKKILHYLFTVAKEKKAEESAVTSVRAFLRKCTDTQEGLSMIPSLAQEGKEFVQLAIQDSFNEARNNKPELFRDIATFFAEAGLDEQNIFAMILERGSKGLNRQKLLLCLDAIATKKPELLPQMTQRLVQHLSQDSAGRSRAALLKADLDNSTLSPPTKTQLKKALAPF